MLIGVFFYGDWISFRKAPTPAKQHIIEDTYLILFKYNFFELKTELVMILRKC